MIQLIFGHREFLFEPLDLFLINLYKRVDLPGWYAVSQLIQLIFRDRQFVLESVDLAFISGDPVVESSDLGKVILRQDCILSQIFYTFAIHYLAIDDHRISASHVIRYHLFINSWNGTQNSFSYILRCATTSRCVVLAVSVRKSNKVGSQGIKLASCQSGPTQ